MVIGITRRAFLQSSGAALTASAAGAAKAAKADSGPAAPSVPALAAPLTLVVNGVRHTLDVEPQMTLVEVLRGPLNLMGTKIGCDRGSCSACTVLIDGIPIVSCMLFAGDVGARKVTTVEGLANGDTLHPVQAAFIAHDAMQCGFCTPGMVLSSAALLERNRSPSLAEIKSALTGHLCRCGTYPHVFAAIQEVAAQKRSG
jgi:aerobic-type carbon monoxide dehydrogenase small subunit (CoxS/CutS family)